MTTFPGNTGPGPVRASITLGIATNAALAVVISMAMVDADLTATWIRIGSSVLCALGFLSFASALHDLMDLRPPRTGVRPRLSPAQGTLIATAGLLLSLFAARLLGGDAVDVTLVLASLTLFYNAVARFIPGIGLLVPAALAAGIMLIPDWLMPLSPVVWLVMTIVVMVTIGVYLLEDIRPVMSSRAWASVAVGWLVMSGVILSLRPLAGEGLVWTSLEPLGLLWPIAAVVALGVLLRFTVSRAQSRHASAHVLIRWTGVYQPMLAASWCAAIHAWTAAIVLAILGAACLVLVGGVRDLGVFGQPPTWR